MIQFRIKLIDHPDVFGVWDNGLVRHLGPAENAAWVKINPSLPLYETTDVDEYNRLVGLGKALTGGVA